MHHKGTNDLEIQWGENNIVDVKAHLNLCKCCLDVILNHNKISKADLQDKAHNPLSR
jgi:hypothetical protein